jgi:hypothetical protein
LFHPKGSSGIAVDQLVDDQPHEIVAPKNFRDHSLSFSNAHKGGTTIIKIKQLAHAVRLDGELRGIARRKPNLTAGSRASRTPCGSSIANETRESKTKVIHKSTFGLPEF